MGDILIKEKLENYINIFFKKFKSFLEWKGIFMSADVYFDKRNYIIVNFKIEENKPENLITYIGNCEEQSRFTEIVDILIPPENIKGVEKTSFYVIKPNELINWRATAALSDYYEFKAAFLRASRNAKFRRTPNQ